jgi:hypothetical protein
LTGYAGNPKNRFFDIMKLIIDSGSTKADWGLTGSDIRFTSEGMNPCIINVERIRDIIRNAVKPELTEKVSEIFFYGAGCSEENQKEVVREAFSSVFLKSEMHVDIDTMAAVNATCNGKAGIACIIGTGSNSIFFNGKNAEPNNYGLGFILADEGAGTWLGKKLITHFLYGLLPADLNKRFQESYSLTRDEAIQNCYGSTAANTWLASYAKFLVDNKSHPWVVNTVSEGFSEFIHLYVMNYQDFRKYPVHFIGSIAFLFKDILIDVMKSLQLETGSIIRKPMEGLLKFHSQNS